MVQPLWKTVQRCLKKEKVQLPYDPAFPHLAIYPKGLKSERSQHSDVHRGTNHNSQDVETMQMSVDG